MILSSIWNVITTLQKINSEKKLCLLSKEQKNLQPPPLQNTTHPKKTQTPKANSHKVLLNYQEKNPCVLSSRFMRKLAKTK